MKSLFVAIFGLTLLDVAPSAHGADGLVDPGVFVADMADAAAVGPPGIEHAAGFRPAKLASEAKSTPVNTAQGRPPGFDFGHWRVAAAADWPTRLATQV